jgi:hypothetical protein
VLDFYGGERHEAFVVSEVHGTWRKAEEVPGTAALNKDGVAIASVSCASAGHRSAGGSYAAAIFRETGDRHSEAMVLDNFGTALQETGQVRRDHRLPGRHRHLPATEDAPRAPIASIARRSAMTAPAMLQVRTTSAHRSICSVCPATRTPPSATCSRHVLPIWSTARCCRVTQAFVGPDGKLKHSLDYWQSVRQYSAHA